MKQRLLLIILPILLALGCIALWVALDDTFIVGADELNLIQNPYFEDENEQGDRIFDPWQAAGCASLTRKPKPGGLKGGPVQFGGLCNPGDTATAWQTFPVTGLQAIDFQYQEILKGDNHIVVTFDDGAGWEWIARDTTAQNNNTFTPVVTSTIPMATDWLTMTIHFEHCPNLILEDCGIGSKVTAVTVTGD